MLVFEKHFENASGGLDMNKISLNGKWEMRATDESVWHLAQVPGTVYTDLLRDGSM